MKQYIAVTVGQWLAQLPDASPQQGWELVAARWRPEVSELHPHVHHLGAWTYLDPAPAPVLDPNKRVPLDDLVAYLTSEHKLGRPTTSGRQPFAGWIGLGAESLVLPWEYLNLVRAYQDEAATWVRDIDGVGPEEVCRVRVLGDGCEIVEFQQRLLRQLLRADDTRLVRCRHLHLHSDGPYEHQGQPQIEPWPGARGWRRSNEYSLASSPQKGFDEALVLDVVGPATRTLDYVLEGMRESGAIAFPYTLDEDGEPVEAIAEEAPNNGYFCYVRFDARVLDKYRNDPVHGSVEEMAGIVRGGGFVLDATLDDAHDEVTAMLVDLNQLPLEEQRHWRVHTLDPAPGRQVSTTRLRRDLMATPADGFQAFPSFVVPLRRAIEVVNEAAEDRFGSALFRPMTDPVGERVWRALRVPADGAVLDLSQQLTLFRQILADPADKATARAIWDGLSDDEPSTDWNALTLVEKALATRLEESDIHASIGTLRSVVGIASRSVHAGGLEGKLAERLDVAGKPEGDAWRILMTRATKAMQALAQQLRELDV